MRHDMRPTQSFRKPVVSALPAGSPKPGGAARPPASAPAAKLVRFPCGHKDSETQLAGSLRERKNAVWVRCPCCNVIAVTVAIIKTR